MTRLTDLAEALAQDASRVDPTTMQALEEAVARAPRVFVTGAGRSGLVAAMFANRLMHLGRPVHLVGEVTCPAIGPDDLLLAVSRSGNTAGVLAAARGSSELGAAVACLTAVADSPLAQLAGPTLVLPAPSLAQPLGSGFEQLCFLVLEAVLADLADRLGVDEAGMAARHANLE
ncbi:6-phospho-3-hexuloisomerase [Luteococcus peritonei]|uniref:6-phospho-3-hexuloisomerase n=1 Tax=Luteococcus peritonei TaxID=88874 RepID=A0ABW4RWX1_9ACTN